MGALAIFIFNILLQLLGIEIKQKNSYGFTYFSWISMKELVNIYVMDWLASFGIEGLSPQYALFVWQESFLLHILGCCFILRVMQLVSRQLPFSP